MVLFSLGSDYGTIGARIKIIFKEKFADKIPVLLFSVHSGWFECLPVGIGV